MNPLYIDYRDGSKEMMAYPCVATIAESTTLEFGDAMVVGNGPDGPVLVGVELKSIHDLISSIWSGRLGAKQLPGLLRDYPGHAWLLWFGQVRAGDKGELEIYKDRGRRRGWQTFRMGHRDIPYAWLQSRLFEMATTGVKIARVNDEAEAAAWLATLHRFWSKPWIAHKGLSVLDQSGMPSLLPGMDETTRLIITVAASLPGIGFDRAYSAANQFDSVLSMVNASVEDWQQVPKIGKVVAKAVYEAVRRSRG